MREPNPLIVPFVFTKDIVFIDYPPFPHEPKIDKSVIEEMKKLVKDLNITIVTESSDKDEI